MEEIDRRWPVKPAATDEQVTMQSEIRFPDSTVEWLHVGWRSHDQAKLTRIENGSSSRLLLVNQSSPDIPFGTFVSGNRKCRL